MPPGIVTLSFLIVGTRVSTCQRLSPRSIWISPNRGCAEAGRAAIARAVMAGLVPAIPIHVALLRPPKRDRRNKSGDDRRRRHATFTPAIHEASQAIIAARILHSRLIMDARVIGVRKHAVLRTAMPAHDARYQPIARDAGLVPAMTRYGQLQRGQTRVT